MGRLAGEDGVKTISTEEYQKLTGQARPKWAAKPTWACLQCGQASIILGKEKGLRQCGIPTCKGAARRFPSKTEARVFGQLVAAFGHRRVLCQATFPLLVLGPDEHGKPFTFSLDFLVLPDGLQPQLYIDAKSGRRRSPEWRRGKAAFEQTYNVKVREVSDWKTEATAAPEARNHLQQGGER